ncbi:MAG: BadF/BadG/BcrA/BcrD ATPase family protein [Anaerolineae bacterium]|nr:BadF/BadG/BcrA/BcrD ATPase family protein [Anaerolineae bacterium]
MAPIEAQLYLGIDAGATKTHALVADRDGHVWGGGRSGPGNWEGVGLDGAYEAYAQAMQQALAAAGLSVTDLCGAGYALAGVDFPSDEPRLGSVVERLGVPGPRVVVNDTFGALRAGARRGYGVVVIAGTGTTVAGMDRHGRRFRTFGEGPMLGDLGGAGDIVSLAVRAVATAYTGRGQPTALTERLLRQYNLHDPLELIESLCRYQVGLPSADLAPLVFEVAEAGDEVARGIIRYAGSELGANAAAVARKLDLVGEAFDLVLAGGVFRSRSELLIGSLEAEVRAAAPHAETVLLDTLPVVGSVLLAMDAAGVEVTANARERLGREARQLLGEEAGR